MAQAVPLRLEPVPGLKLGAARESQLTRRTMVVLILGTTMASLDATLANVALVSIERGLRSPVADAHWVITAYLLAAASVIPVSGWLARRLGARRLYITALVLFAGASGLCALAGSLAVLVVFRMLQGMASGLLMPVGQLIAAEVAGSARIGRTLSHIWMAAALGSIAGPSVGGVIVGGLGWRWIFLINVAIGLLATLAAVRLLPATRTRAAGQLDVTGFMRLSIGLPCLLFGLSEAARNGSLAATLVPLALGLALLLDFVRHALRIEAPLLDLRLCARRLFATGALSLFLFDIAWYGALVLLPLYFQQVHHLTPALAGLLLAPQGIGIAIGLGISGQTRNPARGAQRAVVGATVLAGTTAALGHLGPGTPHWVMGLVLLVAGFAAGLAWIPATAASYAGLSGDEISHASPLVTTVMRVGAAFGTALAAVVLQRELHGHPAGGPTAHLADAYVGSFQWLAVAALAAAVVFVALSRAMRLRTEAPLARHELSSGAAQRSDLPPRCSARPRS